MSRASLFVDALQQRLRQPLPGAVPMRAWAPRLAYGRHFVPPPGDARQSAVAILLYQRAGEWFVPLTLRPATLTHHAGQVSLPGGSLEAGETPEAAAWRELQEELGIAPAQVTTIGRLTPIYIFASNFYVTPCVAVASQLPSFLPSADEVEAVLEAPLSTLPRGAPEEYQTIERGGLRFEAPCWQVGAQRVWGASAMILAELAALVAEIRHE